MAAGIKRPDITPDMKVGVLLDAYPELADVLISSAPAFKKLRNPVLRRTVAKLTSLRQAAQVGGVSLGEMIGKLRTAAGVQEQWHDEETNSTDAARPEWFDPAKIVDTFDATELIEGGGFPLPEVMSVLRGLEAERIYAIITPFTPAPMIDKAREAGYLAWCEQTGTEEFITYFFRKENK